MTTGIQAALLRRGLPADRIHVEHFDVPATTVHHDPAAPPHNRNITIVHNGTPSRVVAYPGDTVLDSGLRAGLDLPYACRAGVCGTCRAVTAAEPQPILACQTHPAPGATIDFDAAGPVA